MRVMPLESIMRLPVMQAVALRAGLIATDPALAVEIGEGYIKQETRQRLEEKMKALNE